MNNNDFRLTPPPVTTMTAIKLPGVRHSILPSGLELVTYDSCSEPVSYLTYVSPGGESELPSPSVAALIAAVRREGTLRYSATEINEILDFNGAWLKAEITNHHSRTSMRTLNATLRPSLEAFRELLFHPVFPEKAVGVRRESLARNLEVAMTDVDFLAYCASERITKGIHHPDARTDDPAQVRNISSQTLRDSFAEINSRGTLFLCGNITSDTLRLVTDIFSDTDIPSHPPRFRTEPFSPAPEGHIEIIEKTDALQSCVFITLPAPPRDHPDYIPLHIAVAALGGYFGSRLMLNIREKLGLTYGISASLLGTHDGACIRIQADTDCGSTRKLCEEVSREMSRMASDPPAGDELICLKQWLLSSQAAILDSPFSIIDHHIAALTSNIPQGYFDSKTEAIARLTPDTIADMASKYMQPQAVRTAIAGNKQSRSQFNM